MRFFFSTGEASGDAYGVELYKLLSNLKPDAEFEGICGKHLAAQAGFKQVLDSTNWGAVGIAEAFKTGPKVLLSLSKAYQALATGEPGVFIPIDFGFVNKKLVRKAVTNGWRVNYFIPPGSWRNRPYGGELVQLCEKLVVPFSWSVPQTPNAESNVKWFGHPLLEILQTNAVQPRGESLAVFVGSRKPEVERVMRLAAQVLQGWQVDAEFAIAPHLDAQELNRRWIQLSGRTNDRFIKDDKVGILQRAKAALVCSGTATLEAALCDCPMVVIYPIRKLVHLQGHLMGLTGKDISLPNILLQERIIPEFAGHSLDPRAVRAALDKVWGNPSDQQQALRKVKQMCGEPHAISEAAKWFAS